MLVLFREAELLRVVDGVLSKVAAALDLLGLPFVSASCSSCCFTTPSISLG